MKKHLHIVNGDSVGIKLEQTELEGEVLVWRELLTQGPIYPDLEDAVHLRTRAEVLERIFAIPASVYESRMKEQHARLELVDQYEQVNLWFEYDFFDATILTYLLHWFSTRPDKLKHVNLCLMCVESFPGKPNFKGLGELSPEQLLGLAGAWHEVTADELSLGAKAWNAYASRDPMDLQRLLDGDMTAIPTLRAAWTAHLQRFPFSSNGGWNRIETEIIAVRERLGSIEFERLFREVSDRLPVYGLGDIEMRHILRYMDKALPSTGPETSACWASSPSEPMWLGGASWIGPCPWVWDTAQNRLIEA